MIVVYYESRKRDLKTRPTYECRCDERPKTKSERFTICVVYYESKKRELKISLMNEGRCDERLKVRVEESTCLAYHWVASSFFLLFFLLFF